MYRIMGGEAMNENEFPDNKTLLKRSCIALAVIVIIIALVCAKENLYIAVWILASALSIFLISLFIRLCLDVHKIAKHITKGEEK